MQGAHPAYRLKQAAATVTEISLACAAVVAQAVAVQGTHPAYRLKQADLTCSSLAELSIINVRRLFAVRDSEFMALKKQGAERPPRHRRTTNAVFD